MNRNLSWLIAAIGLVLASCGPEALPTDGVAPNFAAGGENRGITGNCTGTYSVSDPVFLPPPNDDELASFIATVGGECNLGHLGHSTMSARLLITFDSDGIHEHDDPVTLVSAAGDELHLLETAEIGDFKEDGSFSFSGTWVVAGGTGRFEHATGTVALSGSGNTDEFTTNRKVRGWISY